MKLFDVKVSLMILAKDEESAKQVAQKYLRGDIEIDYNFLVHSAELDESHASLAKLREKQSA